MSETTAQPERVRILLEVSAPVMASEQGDDQAETPWSTAADFLEYASGWNSEAELRIVEPPEPAGTHYFGTVLVPTAESLYCWKHLKWEQQPPAESTPA